PRLSLSPIRALPPPRPTPFPYTTLFRSLVEYTQTIEQIGGNGMGGARPRVPAQERADRRRLHAHAGQRARPQPARAGPPAPQLADRKSTRLNSSHQIISYAVFCLTKKNT